MLALVNDTDLRVCGCSLKIHRVESALSTENTVGISVQAHLASAKLSVAAGAKAVIRAVGNYFDCVKANIQY